LAAATDRYLRPAGPQRADAWQRYATFALGYTMVYGILGLINLARGDLLMVGAMIARSAVGVRRMSPPFYPRNTRMSLKELLERHQLLELQLVVAREREAEIALTGMVRTCSSTTSPSPN
jgi:Branched-chain amino acid transport system / permease component